MVRDDGTETSTRAAMVSRRTRIGTRMLFGAAGCALAIFGSATCGGTTGREGLSMGDDADGGATLDAAELDDSNFDVGITYADRVVPDVVAPPDTGGAASYPWPMTCAPFIPVGPNGAEVPLGAEVNQIPAVFDGDGGELPAPDGSACATYGWLGSTTIDNCLTSQASGFGSGDFPFLPACNWCADSGVAAQGPGAGIATYTLCLNLYACAIRTGCGAEESPSACLCGSASASDCIVDAGGPCATEELAALQATPSSVQTALTNYTQIDTEYHGYCGSALNFVFQNARTQACFIDGGQ
jgi:hypothetical protein